MVDYETKLLTPILAGLGRPKIDPSLNALQLINYTGTGLLSGSFPLSMLTSGGNLPSQAEIRILYRPNTGDPGDGILVGTTTCNADGTWQVANLSESLKFDIVARIPGFNDVIISDVQPTGAPLTAHFVGIKEKYEYREEVSIQVVALGGRPPYVFEAVSLPDGLSIDTLGNITGIMLGKLGVSFSVTVTDSESMVITLSADSYASVNPAELFANGQQGAWYDPSDLSTLFKDTGGTQPVTQDGDPVALMLDKSGNSQHMRQTIVNRRPLYREQNGLVWLEFDGVDDYMTAGISTYINSATELVAHLAVNLTGGDEYGGILSKSTSSTYNGFNINHATEVGIRIHGFGSNNSSRMPYSLGEHLVISALWKHSADLAIYKNGVVVESNMPTTNNPNAGSQDLTLGKLSYGEFYTVLNFYGGVITVEDVYRDILEIAEWLGKRAGI